MKKCESCNNTYTDDYAFCPDCGSPLTDIQAAPPTQNVYPQQPQPAQNVYQQPQQYQQPAQNTYQQPQYQQQPQNAYPQQNVPAKEVGWFGSWGWLLFMTIGLIGVWAFSALGGLVFGIVGFIGAWRSGSVAKKIVAVVLGLAVLISVIIYFVLVWFFT